MIDYNAIVDKWKKNRRSIKRPCALHKKDDLERVRKQILRKDEELLSLRADLEEEYGHLLDMNRDALCNMIPDTTPGPCLFNLPPEHDVGVPHGMWIWDPKNPDVITDEVTGTVFPNDRYKEDSVLQTYWGKPQNFSFYTGKSMEYNGYHLYPSFTGMIRARKSEYMIRGAYGLALLYYLTDDIRYALKAADILLRFADVYPYWLVHGMYGDIADMDPKIAAENPKNLPKERTCMAPNMPKKEIHVGYWGLGRGSITGMEGSAITLPAALAYDLVADIVLHNGIPVLTEEEKEHIELNLLIESATLTYNDDSLNNKNTGNKIGILSAGLVTGVDDFVDMGVECFNRIIDNWYLKDGSTSESPAYSLMVMHTLWILSEMLEGCKDLPILKKPISVYDRPKYHAIWKGMYDTLLQNLLYPASADSYPDTSLNLTYSRILAYRFRRPEYWALYLKVKENEKKKEHVKKTGIQCLPFDNKEPLNPSLVFRDLFFPDLRQGYLRIGKNNEKGTLVLNASEWGIHHHYDSLNLFYYYDNTEWLSDLGYLWDQPHKFMTVRTAAHQLVIVDEEEQKSKGRNGFLHHFVVKDGIKLVDLSSDVYPQVTSYRRACLVVEHDDDRHYILDLFRVDGGTTKDYLIHGIHFNYEIKGLKKEKRKAGLPYDLEDPEEMIPESDRAVITWFNDEKDRFDIFLPDILFAEEKAVIATGFGQRGKTDLGAKIPYLLRRYDKNSAHTFVTVMGARKEQPVVKGFTYKTDRSNKRLFITVELEDGSKDMILYQFEPSDEPFETDLGSVSFDGVMAYMTLKDGKLSFESIYGGKRLVTGEYIVEGKLGRDTGVITDYNTFGFYTRIPSDYARSWIGNTVYITDGTKKTGYPVIDVAEDEKGTFIRTLNDAGDGFLFSGGTEWRMEYYEKLR
jgi:hypothetical protein